MTPRKKTQPEGQGIDMSLKIRGKRQQKTVITFTGQREKLSRAELIMCLVRLASQLSTEGDRK